MAGIVVRLSRDHGNDSLLQWADNEARRTGETLTLVSLWSEPVDLELAVPAGTIPEVTVPAVCRVGSPSQGLDLLRDDPDLVVLSGADGLDRRSRGVMHDARCPVVLVPASPRRRRGRVAVGVCETVASRAALSYAAALAASTSSELVVVQAWQRTLRSTHRPADPGQSLGDPRDRGDTLWEWIRTVADPADLQVRRIEGPPMEVLLEAADDADVIVLGRHLRNHLAQIWHGAVGVDVCRHAASAVVIVPS